MTNEEQCKQELEILSYKLFQRALNNEEVNLKEFQSNVSDICTKYSVNDTKDWVVNMFKTAKENYSATKFSVNEKHKRELQEKINYNTEQAIKFEEDYKKIVLPVIKSLEEKYNLQFVNCTDIDFYVMFKNDNNYYNVKLWNEE